MNVALSLEQSSKRHPTQIAVVFKDRQYSYGELEERAICYAHYFRQKQVQKTDRIALYLPNGVEFISAYYGALKVGAVPVSVGILLKHDEVRHILNDSKSKVLITTDAAAENVPEPEEIPSVADIVSESGACNGTALEAILRVPHGDLASEAMQPDDVAAILYTSATTGRPKGVMLTHRNILANADETIRAVRMSPDDRHLCCLPLYHVFGQNFILNSGIRTSSTIILEDKFDREATLRTIREHCVNKVYGVPSMYEAWLALPDVREQLTSVEYAFSAAAILKPETERRWEEATGLLIHQGYGLTESSPFASYNHWTKHKFNSIGQPIQGVTMKVVDIHTLLEVVPREPGEILIRGSNVMRGYLNDEQATRETILAGGWLRSGDVGCRDEEGYFYFLDRVKDVIVPPGGFNVYPKEVEEFILGHSAIREVAVVGDVDEAGNEAVKAYVVLSPGAALTEDELLTFCREKMAKYKVPKKIEFTDSLPKSSIGKVLKRSLRESHARDHRQ